MLEKGLAVQEARNVSTSDDVDVRHWRLSVAICTGWVRVELSRGSGDLLCEDPVKVLARLLHTCTSERRSSVWSDTNRMTADDRECWAPLVGAVILSVTILVILDARSILDKAAAKVASGVILGVVLCLNDLRHEMWTRRWCSLAEGWSCVFGSHSRRTITEALKTIRQRTTPRMTPDATFAAALSSMLRASRMTRIVTDRITAPTSGAQHSRSSAVILLVSDHTDDRRSDVRVCSRRARTLTGSSHSRSPLPRDSSTLIQPVQMATDSLQCRTSTSSDVETLRGSCTAYKPFSTTSLRTMAFKVPARPVAGLTVDCVSAVVASCPRPTFVPTRRMLSLGDAGGRSLNWERRHMR